jgi:AcrR family transcriptional regulator
MASRTSRSRTTNRTPARGRRTQSERKEQSARALLDAATALIAEQGFTRTTLGQIGQKAGYSRGMVTERFGSKSELIQTLAEEFQSLFAVDHLTPALAGLSGVDAVVVTVET